MDFLTKNHISVFHRYPSVIFLLVAITISGLLSGTTLGQLSPGDLHESHAHLEGLKNCSECHGIGQKISADNCLVCHNLIKERIVAREGLHAQPGYSECETCHVEHHGRDFDLIYWKDGQQNFDHQQTGFALEGKHFNLACRDCHREKFISEKEKFLKQKKNLERTFLGLDKSCLGCHHDEHRGQLSKDCLNCHNFKSWKPAEKFSHQQAGFLLKGKHASLPCEKCHTTLTGQHLEDDSQYLKFTGISYKRCTDCHADVHGNKFGQNCQTCHNPAGWKKYNTENFDHSKTSFPLIGRHLSTPCAKCHPPDRPLKISQFSKCRDCHRDYHKGQFSDRTSQKDCIACHSEQGFIPVNFSLAEHNQTRFPLEGSHLAIPCNLCHSQIHTGTPGETIQFRFVSTRCIDCHQDPHQNTATRFISKEECQGCHNINSWRMVNFDHQKTRFPLEGRHGETECIACHFPEPGKQILFTGLEANCYSCHKDPHQGQFARDPENQKSVTDCGKCHSPENWKALRFDHNLQAVFKLEGAHANLDCKKCHFAIEKNGATFIKFKPIPHNCIDCHGESIKKEGLKNET